MINIWLERDGKKLKRMVELLNRCRMSGSYEDKLNLNEITTLLNSAHSEVTRLKLDLDVKIEAMNRLNQEVQKQKNIPIFQNVENKE